MESQIAVFCGPSLPAEDRISDERVVYMPSARRGDVELAANRYDIVLLIDGAFHQALAPSPKECYRASQAAKCFGAASMGALRAVECSPYGFVPLGIIADWYAGGAIDGDDEVAVLVDADTERALTVASVNVRYLAMRAIERCILEPDEAMLLVQSAREIHYTERTWDSLFELVRSDARTAIAQLAITEGDLKRRDARLALATVRNL